jgi:hypothetical protein
MIEVSKMETSPLFDGIREKWIDQGLQQGLREAILEILKEKLELKEKLSICANDLATRLQAVQDQETLKQLFRWAMKAKSLEEFLAALDHAEQKAKLSLKRLSKNPRPCLPVNDT